MKQDVVRWAIGLGVGIIGFLLVRLIGQIDAMSSDLKQLQIDVAVIKKQMEYDKRSVSYGETE